MGRIAHPTAPNITTIPMTITGVNILDFPFPWFLFSWETKDAAGVPKFESNTKNRRKWLLGKGLRQGASTKIASRIAMQ